ncbi:hypothetical protein AA0614_2064 [Komagataeibacter saccharivorans NRIC 0614]|nr:hypothetical protein AA0614_2064 [Komagataeibacter saccharivorans NRIC 0614]
MAARHSLWVKDKDRPGFYGIPPRHIPARFNYDDAGHSTGTNHAPDRTGSLPRMLSVPPWRENQRQRSLIGRGQMNTENDHKRPDRKQDRQQQIRNLSPGLGIRGVPAVKHDRLHHPALS